MAKRLSPDEIRERRASLPEWKLEGKSIVRELRFEDFARAIAFVNRLAEVAEAADHHPDILIHYREVKLTLWTHTADGLTAKDFDLAAALEKLPR